MQEEQKITKEDSSPLSDRIWIIHQDAKQNYWFGSNDYGVYKYDGEQLISYNQKNGLVDSQIRGIQEDKLGNLYFDTPTGISKFDGQSFETLKPIESEEWVFNEDDLWFKENGNFPGAYRYDGKQLYALKFPDFDLEKGFGRKFEETQWTPWGTYTIYQDPKGHLWFGTLAAGVLRFDGKDWLWIAEDELTTLEDGRVPAIRVIFEDQDGYYWLSHAISKYKIEDFGKEGVRSTYQKHTAIEGAEDIMGLPYFNSALIDKSGVIWMTAYTNGLWKFENGKLSHNPVKIGGETAKLISIYKDRLGKIWLGTDNLGVLHLKGDQFVRFELEK